MRRASSGGLLGVTSCLPTVTPAGPATKTSPALSARLPARTAGADSARIGPRRPGRTLGRPAPATRRAAQAARVVGTLPLDDGAGLAVIGRRIQPVVADQDAVGRAIDGVDRPSQGEQQERIRGRGSDPVEPQQLLTELVRREVLVAERLGRARVVIDDPAGHSAKRAERSGRHCHAGRLERLGDLRKLGLGQRAGFEQTCLTQAVQGQGQLARIDRAGQHDGDQRLEGIEILRRAQVGRNARPGPSRPQGRTHQASASPSRFERRGTMTAVRSTKKRCPRLKAPSSRPSGRGPGRGRISSEAFLLPPWPWRYHHRQPWSRSSPVGRRYSQQTHVEW